jgi:hypothetical protein
MMRSADEILKDAAGWFAHSGYLYPERPVAQRPARRRSANIATAQVSAPPATITLQIPAGIDFDHLW